MERPAIMRQDGDEERLEAEAKAGEDAEFHFLPGPPYEWAEIEEFLANPREILGGGYDRPETRRKCAYCGKLTKLIFWASDPETWAHLCGRAGMLEYCPACKAWYPIEVTLLN